ncbi:hypothetical protein GMORB2_0096 [Geosmithia morbida]|uniref:Peptidyl-tRNA hydrolase n=1 Tax=Geosmithia morbida TaxID=1094350 RepID=A0A9P4Z0L6_9HYPO|nr:uncharacterized protein GMORB2_0096 [Geosmithia morbida]KAF4126360.1 hypothetical protein GMORB2_0096 [Geosmithia morbida]
MRFSLSTAVAALPALAAAQESPLEQYQAQFQNFVSNFGSYVPSPARHDAAAAHAAKTGPMKLHVLTLDTWKDTLYEPVQAGATTPEEWWVFTTGGNKTCFGQCGRAELAFNETATRFAAQPTPHPHMGLLNCEDQPILCNAWSAGVGSIWAFDMLPEPAPVNIYKKRLNLTSVTSDDIAALQGNRDQFVLLESFWHPFNGKAAELGVAVPLAYTLWLFNLLPNWAFMLAISMFSRTMV